MRNAEARPPIHYDDLIEVLNRRGQAHLVEHLKTLAPEARERLSAELAAIDWAAFHHRYTPPTSSQLQPFKVVTQADREELRKQAEALGREAYEGGEIAVSMTAGGQGTRLGMTQPKGLYPIAPVSGKSFYQIAAEKILNLCEETGKPVHFLLMTSSATHADTMAFLAEHRNFGLPPQQLHLFSQGALPTTDKEGQLLLAAPDRLLTNPDGHGGWFDAIRNSGMLAFLREHGVKELVFIQVDNVLAPVRDDFAVGLRRMTGADIVCKVLRKSDPAEKVGSLVQAAGAAAVIEYIDRGGMLERHAELLQWGVPNMHLFSVEFLARSTAALPCHLSEKRVPEAADGSGLKREKLIYDIFPTARVVGLEVERSQEFAPVKNLSGIDSVESAARLITNEHKRWLRHAGVGIDLAPDAFLEISPSFAVSAEQFAARWQQIANRPGRIGPEQVKWLASLCGRPV